MTLLSLPNSLSPFQARTQLTSIQRSWSWFDDLGSTEQKRLNKPECRSIRLCHKARDTASRA